MNEREKKAQELQTAFCLAQGFMEAPEWDEVSKDFKMGFLHLADLFMSKSPEGGMSMSKYASQADYWKTKLRAVLEGLKAENIDELMNETPEKIRVFGALIAEAADEAYKILAKSKEADALSVGLKILQSIEIARDAFAVGSEKWHGAQRTLMAARAEVNRQHEPQSREDK